MNQAFTYQVQRRTDGHLFRWETTREFGTRGEAMDYARASRGLGREVRVIVWSRAKFEMTLAGIVGLLVFLALFVFLACHPAISAMVPSAFVASGVGCLASAIFAAWAFCLNSDSKVLKEDM